MHEAKSSGSSSQQIEELFSTLNINNATTIPGLLSDLVTIITS